MRASHAGAGSDADGGHVAGRSGRVLGSERGPPRPSTTVDGAVAVQFCQAASPSARCAERTAETRYERATPRLRAPVRSVPAAEPRGPKTLVPSLDRDGALGHCACELVTPKLGTGPRRGAHGEAPGNRRLGRGAHRAVRRFAPSALTPTMRDASHLALTGCNGRDSASSQAAAHGRRGARVATPRGFKGPLVLRSLTGRTPQPRPEYGAAVAGVDPAPLRGGPGAQLARVAALPPCTEAPPLRRRRSRRFRRCCAAPAVRRRRTCAAAAGRRLLLAGRGSALEAEGRGVQPAHA